MKFEYLTMDNYANQNMWGKLLEFLQWALITVAGITFAIGLLGTTEQAYSNGVLAGQIAFVAAVVWFLRPKGVLKHG